MLILCEGPANWTVKDLLLQRAYLPTLNHLGTCLSDLSDNDDDDEGTDDDGDDDGWDFELTGAFPLADDDFPDDDDDDDATDASLSSLNSFKLLKQGDR